MADGASPVNIVTPNGYSYAYIATQTTTLVKTGQGVLHSITINTPAATGTITVYDGLSASGTKFATITSFAAGTETFLYDVIFGTGLTIVTATANVDITVAYR